MAFGLKMVALWAPWLVKLKFGALRTPPSNSFGGLMAFGHQMGGLQAPWRVTLKFGTLLTPPSSSCGGLVAFCHLGGPFGPSAFDQPSGALWAPWLVKFVANKKF